MVLFAAKRRAPNCPNWWGPGMRWVASAYEDLKGDLEMPTGTLIKKVQTLYAYMADEGMF